MQKVPPSTSPILLTLLILFYLVLNLSLNLYNKMVFSTYHFNFPIIIMFFHQGLVYFALRTCTLLNVLPRPTLATQHELAGPVMIVGTFFAINIICNNASLMYISLSLNQCLKAASPLIMICVAFFVERKATPLRQTGAACIVVVGSFLVALKNPGFDLLGVGLCLLSAATAAFQFSTASIVMQGNTNLVFHVTMYTALVVTFLTLPAVVALELDDFHAYAQEHSMLKCMGLLMLGGSMALLYLLVTNALIVNGGSVYLTVLGNFKLALIVLVSCWVFNDQLETINVVGIVITVVGFVFYSYVKKSYTTSTTTLDAAAAAAAADAAFQTDGEDVDALGSNEEIQSLLVNGEPNRGGRGGRGGSSGRGSGSRGLGNSQEEGHSRTALFIELGMAFFILAMAAALVLNPHHASLRRVPVNATTSEQLAWHAASSHAAAFAAHGEDSPHHSSVPDSSVPDSSGAATLPVSIRGGPLGVASSGELNPHPVKHGVDT